MLNTELLKPANVLIIAVVSILALHIFKHFKKD